MTKRRNALVIGAGPMAVEVHLPILKRLADAGEISLVSVCDLDDERAESARKEFGFVRAARNPEAECANPEIDLVYIFATAQAHFALGRVALEHGKHLFIEKPLAPSAGELMFLVSIARDKGVCAVGGMNRRFYKSLEVVKQRVHQAGWESARATFNKPAGGKTPPFGAMTWLSANGVHALDALIYISDSTPKAVVATARSVDAKEPNVFEAEIEFENGLCASFVSDNASAKRLESYEITVGDIRYIASEDALRTHTQTGSDDVVLADNPRGFEDEHREFLTGCSDRSFSPRHELSRLVPSLIATEAIECGHSGPLKSPESLLDDGNGKVRQKPLLAVWGHGPSLHSVLPTLTKVFEIVPVSDAYPDSRLARVEALFMVKRAALVTHEIRALMPRLRFVGVPGLSLRKYTPELFLESGVRIFNASKTYGRTVSELALAFAILGRRRALESHELMRLGGWGTRYKRRTVASVLIHMARWMRPILSAIGVLRVAERAWGHTKGLLVQDSETANTPHSLTGSSVGLIGWGEGAKEFVALLRPFSVKVLVYSEHLSDSECATYGVTRASLSDVLSCSTVSLHRGLTERTRHCIGERELSELRSGATLINIARGELIDTTALVTRLSKGDITAFLDVFDSEPLPRSHPLRKQRNVFLTSHIAGVTQEMKQEALEEVVAKLLTAMSGGEVQSVNSLERLNTMT